VSFVLVELEIPGSFFVSSSNLTWNLNLLTSVSVQAFIKTFKSPGMLVAPPTQTTPFEKTPLKFLPLLSSKEKNTAEGQSQISETKFHKNSQILHDEEHFLRTMRRK
jgi:hypothetical protein